MRQSLQILASFAIMLLLAGILFLGSEGPVRADESENVRIGLIQDVFADFPSSAQEFFLTTFSEMIYQQTGIKGTSVAVKDEFELAEQMEEKKIQLGIFHGYEFALAQEKNPKLKPLIIMVVQRPFPLACLVTRDDSDVSGFADLKGKAVSLPKKSRPHCRVYLARECVKSGGTGKDAVKIHQHPNIEAGLDDVVRGDVAGMVVDKVSLDAYRQVKPGCYKKLKIVEQSPEFPAGTIACREGFVDQGILDRLRKGLLVAHKNPQGQLLMSMWRLTAFAAIPKDYQQTLNEIRKVYPASEVEAGEQDSTPTAEK